MLMVGCTPGTCAQDSRVRSVRDTVASWQELVPLSNRTTRAARGIGSAPVKRCTNVLSGSLRLTDTKRVEGVTFPCWRKSVTASCTSRGVRGSSGWVMVSVMAPVRESLRARCPHCKGRVSATQTVFRTPGERHGTTAGGMPSACHDPRTSLLFFCPHLLFLWHRTGRTGTLGSGVIQQLPRTAAFSPALPGLREGESDGEKNNRLVLGS